MIPEQTLATRLAPAPVYDDTSSCNRPERAPCWADHVDRRYADDSRCRNCRVTSEFSLAAYQLDAADIAIRRRTSASASSSAKFTESDRPAKMPISV